MKKTDDNWLEQMKAPLYMDSKIALKNISDKNSSSAVIKALKNDFWGIRLLGIKKANKLKNKKEFISYIEQHATSDKNTKVKSAALRFLADLENNIEYLKLFESATKEQSLLVAGAGLSSIAKVDTEKALLIAPNFESDLKDVVIDIYAKYAGPEKIMYFQNQFVSANGYDLYYLMGGYTKFLKNQDLNTIIAGTPALEEATENAKSWMVRVGKYYLKDIKSTITELNRKEKNKELKIQANKTLERIDEILR